MSSDRRKSARRRVTEYFTVYDRRTNRLIGTIFDLSADGAMMITEHSFEAQSSLALRMDLPANVLGRQHLYIHAEIKWSKKSVETGIYETGVQFSDLTPQQEELIRTILQKWTVTEVEPASAQESGI